jgi:hypothetical protein
MHERVAGKRLSAGEIAALRGGRSRAGCPARAAWVVSGVEELERLPRNSTRGCAGPSYVPALRLLAASERSMAPSPADPANDLGIAAGGGRRTAGVLKKRRATSASPAEQALMAPAAPTAPRSARYDCSPGGEINAPIRPSGRSRRSTRNAPFLGHRPERSHDGAHRLGENCRCPRFGLTPVVRPSPYGRSMSEEAGRAAQLAHSVTAGRSALVRAYGRPGGVRASPGPIAQAAERHTSASRDSSSVVTVRSASPGCRGSRCAAAGVLEAPGALPRRR